MRSGWAGWTAAIGVLAAQAGAAQAGLFSGPRGDARANHQHQHQCQNCRMRAGEAYPILTWLGNAYTGPLAPNPSRDRLYFGYGYVQNVYCPPFRPNDPYYSPWYNNTSGTYYGPSDPYEKRFKWAEAVGYPTQADIKQWKRMTGQEE